MSDEDDASKTEDPTSRKLGKARQQGQVAQSQEIKSWGLLLVGLLGLAFLAPFIGSHLTRSMSTFISEGHALSLDPGTMQLVARDVFIDLALALGPFMLLVIIAAVGAGIGQFGLLLSWEKLKPKFNRFNPIAGFKRMFSMRQLVEFFKGLAKLTIVTAVGLFVAVPLFNDVETLPGISMAILLDRLVLLGILLVAATVGVMTALAFLDLVYQRYAFKKQMRMTKHEVKDENKETEGDPQIKARLRRIRLERYRQRMMANVPTADVVVTNPTHYAVALTYKIEEMQAPRLVAKGIDHLAARIREIAQENEVPIVENPPLARALYATVELDQEIPYEHYQAVAEIIGYVMRLKGRTLQ
ncbi:MAG: flagellar biosynthesis protein FlhB [Magnetospiraceae bacterium]